MAHDRLIRAKVLLRFAQNFKVGKEGIEGHEGIDASDESVLIVTFNHKGERINPSKAPKAAHQEGKAKSP